jgi:hypothetical protein
MQISDGVHSAHKNQVYAPLLQMPDEFPGKTENSVRQDSVGGYCKSSQSWKMSGLNVANRLQELFHIAAQKGLPSGQVQLPEVVEFRGAEQFLPDGQIEVWNFRGDLPDIAHAAPADTAVGDFEAQGFKPVRLAADSQPPIAHAVADEFPDMPSHNPMCHGPTSVQTWISNRPLG